MVRVTFFLIALVIGACAAATAGPQGRPDIEALRAERNAYIHHFRVTGERRADRAEALEAKLRDALRQAPSGNRAALLYELASLLRMVNQFGQAIATYDAAIGDAAGRGDVVFDSWIGIARAHAYGTHDHGAAAKAFEHAAEAAGPEPSRKQRYEMADYSSHLQSGRGELEAALINALQAERFADTDADRFFAQLDAGDALEKFAGSCDYRPLVDAKSVDDKRDTWGACRRAVDAARSKYMEARGTAERIGWSHLRDQTDGFISQLGLRLTLINDHANDEERSAWSIFSIEDARDVIVNEQFVAGASGLTDHPEFRDQIARVVAESVTEDARSAYLLGLKADIEGNEADGTRHFEKAARLLERERSSLLDLRMRGTVVENRPEFVVNLALRLLARGRYDDAFSAFESIRARGLAELAAAYEAQDFSDAERRWLSGLVDTESHESAILNGLVEATIAGVDYKHYDEDLRLLDELRAERRHLIEEPEFKNTLSRVASAKHVPTKLPELRALAKETGIPLLLYWVTRANVIVWVITPHSMEVKTVFLPEAAVTDKVRRVVESIKTPDRPFDETAARQLYAYLIQPFMHHLTNELFTRYLTSKEVIIIPQGPVVALPFEALIDARTGAFLAEKLAISYAPSATFAAKAMRRAPLTISSLTAIYDNNVEIDTNEIERISRTPAIEVATKPSEDLSANGLIALLGRAKAVHILLHGVFETKDPLQSRIKLNNPAHDAVTAAELLAADWRGTRIAVFSSCEGARLNVRISNEVYGLSWAPLVGGAQAVMMSRWRVLAASNADWMASFYEVLATGSGSPAVAAAKSMRRMIGSRQAHPHYWAAPQVFGR